MSSFGHMFLAKLAKLACQLLCFLVLITWGVDNPPQLLALGLGVGRDPDVCEEGIEPQLNHAVKLFFSAIGRPYFQQRFMLSSPLYNCDDRLVFRSAHLKLIADCPVKTRSIRLKCFPISFPNNIVLLPPDLSQVCISLKHSQNLWHISENVFQTFQISQSS